MSTHIPFACACPHCGATLEAPSDCRGITVKCPSCQGEFIAEVPLLNLCVDREPAPVPGASLSYNNETSTSNQENDDDTDAEPVSTFKCICAHCGETMEAPSRCHGEAAACGSCQGVFIALDATPLSIIHSPTVPSPTAGNLNAPLVGLSFICPHCRTVALLPPADQSRPHCCEYCHEEFQIPAPPALSAVSPPPAPSKSLTGCGGCLIFILIFIVFLIFAAMTEKPQSPVDKDRKKDQDFREFCKEPTPEKFKKIKPYLPSPRF